jgi:hypothetical protein
MPPPHIDLDSSFSMIVAQQLDSFRTYRTTHHPPLVHTQYKDEAVE